MWNCEETTTKHNNLTLATHLNLRFSAIYQRYLICKNYLLVQSSLTFDSISYNRKLWNSLVKTAAPTITYRQISISFAYVDGQLMLKTLLQFHGNKLSNSTAFFRLIFQPLAFLSKTPMF